MSLSGFKCHQWSWRSNPAEILKKKQTWEWRNWLFFISGEPPGWALSYYGLNVSFFHPRAIHVSLKCHFHVDSFQWTLIEVHQLTKFQVLPLGSVTNIHFIVQLSTVVKNSRHCVQHQKGPRIKVNALVSGLIYPTFYTVWNKLEYTIIFWYFIQILSIFVLFSIKKILNKVNLLRVTQSFFSICN